MVETGKDSRCSRGFDPDASAKFTSHEYYDLSMLESVPRFAKIVIPLLTILNLLLLVWIYEEYLNNRFLRIYVNDSLQTGGFATIELVSIGFLAIAAMVLFTKLVGYRRELDRILSTGTFRSMEEGFVNRSIRKLKRILSGLSGKVHRSGGLNRPSATH